MAHSADYMDYCTECEAPAVVVETTIEQDGYEEAARYFSVSHLSCGHTIDIELEGSALRHYLGAL